MTESHVDAAVQARIQAARRRTEDMRRQRAELAAARTAGLAHRHAQKLAYLAEAEQRATERQDDEQDAGVLGHDGAQDLDQPEPRLHMAQIPGVLGHGQDDDRRASVRRTDGTATPTDGAAETTEGEAP